MQQVFNKNIFTTGLLLLVSLLLFIPSTAQAAGSAQFSAESSSSVTTGSNITVSFYATPSSANIYSGEFRASLTNLTFVSYSPSGSPFNGLNLVMSGNSAGSTNFTVAFSHIGPVSGSSSKALIGKAVLKASSSAGTGQVQLSNLVADDDEGGPMSTSASGKTLSITAPSTPTCPAGQIGTPPNCATPSSGSGGTSAPTNTPSNPIDNPNPDSEAIIPTAPDEEPTTVSEDEASIIVSGAERASTTADDLALAKTKGWVLYIVGALGFLVLVGLATKLFLARRPHTVGVAPAAFQPPSNNPSTSTDVTSKSPSPPTSGPEPQIIKPTVKEGGSETSNQDPNTPQT